MTIDSENDVWVVDDLNARVQGFTPSGEFIGKFSSINSPAAIDLDSKGRFWVGYGGTKNSHLERWE